MLKLIVHSFLEGLIQLLRTIGLWRLSHLPVAEASYALDVDIETEFSRKVNRLQCKHGEQSAFYLLIDNIQAFTQRCELIQGAEKTLDLQYYYFQGDTSGHILAQLLVDAANRGVRVRVLLDDIDTLGADDALRILNAHPAIEIRLFNPFRFRGLLRYLEFLTDLPRVGRRMHNKAIIADNALAIVGGRNIGDIYFAAHSEFLFLDIDLLSLGPIVKNISCSFDEYWNSNWAIPVNQLYPDPDKVYALARIKNYLKRYVSTVKSSHLTKSLQGNAADSGLFELNYYWAEARLYYDTPSKIIRSNKRKSSALIEELRDVVAQANSELMIVSAYLIPTESTLGWMQKLVSSGVKIKVLTNSLAATDVIAVHAGYLRKRGELLRMGISVYELKPTAYARHKKKFKILHPGSRTSLHAKTIVIDRQQVFIGSPNLDPRSSDLNTEMGLLVDNMQLAAQVVSMFDEVADGNDSYLLRINKTNISAVEWVSQTDSNEVVFTSDPDVGWWRRLRLSIYRILPIDGLL